MRTVRAVTRGREATVNDVVLAACAGGLRRHLVRLAALPDVLLQLAVPVSLRGDDDRAEVGTRVTAMIVTLRTHLADPTSRLQFVTDRTFHAKRHDEVPAGLLRGLGELAPPVLAHAVRLAMRLTGRIDPPVNAIVSNVPGSEVPLHMAGAEIRAIQPLPPVVTGIGLSVTVLSCRDEPAVGLMTCPDLTPDLWDLLHDVLDEVGRLAEPTGPSGSADRPLDSGTVDPRRASGAHPPFGCVVDQGSTL